jgi:hypothetical protein
MNKINKKGSGQFIVNAALIIAALYFIFFVVLGVSGGFTALWNIGSLLSSIPMVGWIIIIIILLLLWSRRK